MVLQQSEINDKFQQRSKQGIIQRAIHQQNRLKFHAQPILQQGNSQPLTDFLSWVKSLLPKDKFKIFETLFRYPVKTTEVTGICFNKLSRIFEGRNPVFNYQFQSTEMRDDWEYYRQDILDEQNVWKTKGWEHFITDINSVLVVDMPTEPSEGKYPEPYFYFLPIEKVIDFEVNNRTGNMDYIIFCNDDKIAVMDDVYYRLYEKKDNELGTLLVEAPHNLRYCPARFFWNEPLSLQEPYIKRSPLTKQLDALDWFLFFHISKKHLDLYGSYPIYSGYEQECDYEDEKGDYCDGGFLKNKDGQYLYDSNGLMKCPKCGDKRIIGAGSFIEVPVPTENQPDLKNPVQMLSVDTASLDYNVKEENRLRENIITAVCGTDSQLMNTQALNESQVSANFESQSAILNRIKKGFEEAQTFVDDTICRLRYGNQFLSSKINYGTEFFTLTASELRDRYKTAKESGATETELEALATQIMETENRTDPMAMQRAIILRELEPLQHLSLAEAKELFKEGIITREKLLLKVEFSALIKRFEREYGNILEFGYGLPMNDRVNQINKVLESYVSKTE